MDFSKLDELMAMPKKTDASKQNKKNFVEQMGILLGEEGLSENSIKYLKSGFGFAGAKPLAIYIQKYKDEERNKVVDAVLSSELLCGKDKVSAFKFCVNLSAYSIEWFGSDKQLLTGLVKLFPSLSQNKEKKLLKDAPKIFEKYFLEILSVDTALPDLNALGLKEIFIKEYMGTLQLISENITKKYAEKNRKIKEWIRFSSEKNAEDRLVQQHSEECESQESANDNNNQSENTTEEANNEIAAYSAKEILKLGLLFSDISSRLKVTAEKMMELERQYAGSKEQIAKLKLEIKQNEEELQNERKRFEQEKTETERCRGIIADLHEKIRDAGVQNQEQEKKIMSLSEELSKANAVLSVYSVDKQNAQTEQLNAIASKLKAEYRDFKEAENEEMTVDLGENFRFQIQSIFKILSKSGIEVERGGCMSSNFSWFGIDFGTTNSAAFSFTGMDEKSIYPIHYGDDEGRPFPSVVAINKTTGEVICGREAKDQRHELQGTHMYFSSIKSIIDSDEKWVIAGKEWTPEDIAAEILKALKARVERGSDNVMDEVVMAVPVGYSARKKAHLRNAAKKAGIKVKMFISEPTAAFCSNYQELCACKNVAVFDWGGGTLDVVVLKIDNGNISEMSAEGMAFAGNDIDNKLASKMHSRFMRNKPTPIPMEDLPATSLDQLLSKCEKAKCDFEDEDVVALWHYEGLKVSFHIED